MLIIDIETKKLPTEVKGGWNTPFKMGFGTAIVYDYDTDIYYFFNKKQRKKYVNFLKDNIVISFNGKIFDNRVAIKTGIPKWKDLDLLEEVIKSKYNVNSINEAIKIYGKYVVHNHTLKLDGLVYGTLKKQKNGKGELAPKLIKKKKYSKVFEYNLNDVRLLRQLFEYSLQNGFIKDRNGAKIYLNMYQIIERLNNEN